MLNAVAVEPPPSRRSKVWSRNWPHCQANCDSRRSSNTSTLVSLMTRLLIWRALGPPNGWLMPSVYFAGPTRAYGVPALPHVGLLTLLPLPSRFCTSNDTAADADGAMAMMPPPMTAATAATGNTRVSQVFRLARNLTDPPQDFA